MKETGNTDNTKELTYRREKLEAHNRHGDNATGFSNGLLKQYNRVYEQSKVIEHGSFYGIMPDKERDSYQHRNYKYGLEAAKREYSKYVSIFYKQSVEEYNDNRTILKIKDFDNYIEYLVTHDNSLNKVVHNLIKAMSEYQELSKNLNATISESLKKLVPTKVCDFSYMEMPEKLKEYIYQNLDEILGNKQINPWVRCNIAEAVGDLGDTSIVAPLLDMLPNQQIDTRGTL